MPACCTWCNGMRWYILPHQPTTHFHPRIMDFIAMPHTPITFNYKITLFNYGTSKIHAYNKQFIFHSFTMHAARVEWRLPLYPTSSSISTIHHAYSHTYVLYPITNHIFTYNHCNCITFHDYFMNCCVVCTWKAKCENSWPDKDFTALPSLLLLSTCIHSHSAAPRHEVIIHIDIHQRQ